MTPAWRIDGLALTNFRCFTRCELDLHPELTVLVAENGRGKTAILDAIAIALAPLVEELSMQRALIRSLRDRGPVLQSSDVRQVPDRSGAMAACPPVSVRAHGHIGGERTAWRIDLGRATGTPRPSVRGLRRARGAAQRAFGAAVELGAAPPPRSPLPLIAYYGTGRLWADEARGRQARGVVGWPNRLRGYTRCLAPQSRFADLADWYEDRHLTLADPTSKVLDEGESPVKQLAAVRAAARTVLAPTGWRDLDWQTPALGRGYLVAEHPDLGRLPVSRLSDGVRTTLALVADVARRCAELNPHLGEDAPTATPGVLLIDEVDMHLHPRWQQEIVGLLRTAFPRLQLIVTTHSPQVLTTVPADSIRVLEVEDGEAELVTPNQQTLGVESHDVLARVMGVSPTPDVEAARTLSAYRALIQQGLGESDAGKALAASLTAHFGEAHPAMAECRRLSRLQALKPRLPRTEAT